MNRLDILRVAIEAGSTAPIVFTTGHTCREAYQLADRPNHFYMVGSMGMSAAIGLGMAWRTRRPALVVDGDGSLLMNPSVLFLAAGFPGAPLIHLVADNGSHASTGGQPTDSDFFDLEAIALATGYVSAVRTDTAAGVAAALETALANGGGPHFVRAHIAATPGAAAGRLTMTPARNATRISQWLADRINLTNRSGMSTAEGLR